jgi:hypothetical protein
MGRFAEGLLIFAGNTLSSVLNHARLDPCMHLKYFCMNTTIYQASSNESKITFSTPDLAINSRLYFPDILLSLTEEASTSPKMTFILFTAGCLISELNYCSGQLNIGAV